VGLGDAQIDHIYHQFMLTNDDDGHIVHMEDVSDKDLELAEARADAAETTLMHEQEGDDGGLEVAEDDVEEWGEEDVVMEGRDEAAVTVDADDEEGLQREADKEQGWLDIWGESDGEEKPVRRTGGWSCPRVFVATYRLDLKFCSVQIICRLFTVFVECYRLNLKFMYINNYVSHFYGVSSDFKIEFKIYGHW
jgi:hypothetical protein